MASEGPGPGLGDPALTGERLTAGDAFAARDKRSAPELDVLGRMLQNLEARMLHEVQLSTARMMAKLDDVLLATGQRERAAFEHAPEKPASPRNWRKYAPEARGAPLPRPPKQPKVQHSMPQWLQKSFATGSLSYLGDIEKAHKTQLLEDAMLKDAKARADKASEAPSSRYVSERSNGRHNTIPSSSGRARSNSPRSGFPQHSAPPSVVGSSDRRSDSGTDSESQRSQRSQRTFCTLNMQTGHEELRQRATPPGLPRAPVSAEAAQDDASAAGYKGSTFKMIFRGVRPSPSKPKSATPSRDTSPCSESKAFTLCGHVAGSFSLQTVGAYRAWRRERSEDVEQPKAPQGVVPALFDRAMEKRPSFTSLISAAHPSSAAGERPPTPKQKKPPKDLHMPSASNNAVLMQWLRARVREHDRAEQAAMKNAAPGLDGDSVMCPSEAFSVFSGSTTCHRFQDQTLMMLSDTEDFTPTFWEIYCPVSLVALGKDIFLMGCFAVTVVCVRQHFALVKTMDEPEVDSTAIFLRLLDVVYSAGSLCSFFVVWKLQTWILWIRVETMLSEHSFRPKLVTNWRNTFGFRVCVYFSFWLASVIMRALAEQSIYQSFWPMPEVSHRQVVLLRVLVFAFNSGVLTTVMCAVDRMCSIMCMMVSTYCFHAVHSDKPAEILTETWNVLQAQLRHAASNAEMVLFVIMATMSTAFIAAVIVPLQADVCELSSLRVLAIASPMCLLSVRVMTSAATVTMACKNVATLANSLSFRFPTKDRFFMTNGIRQSKAGFYIREVILTGSMVAKMCHIVALAVFAVLSRLLDK